MPKDVLLQPGVTSAKGSNDYIVVKGIPIAPPALGEDEAVVIDDNLAKVLGECNSYKVQQRTDMLEALTFGFIEASNVRHFQRRLWQTHPDGRRAISRHRTLLLRTTPFAED